MPFNPCLYLGVPSWIQYTENSLGYLSAGRGKLCGIVSSLPWLPVTSDRFKPLLSPLRSPLSIIFLALLAAGCGKPPPPDVLLITVDTLRADHVGSYGYASASTPNMDGLATDGVRFSDAISSAPITLPSHTSIMSGIYPPAHGVRDNGVYAVPDQVTTLAEYFKQKGYITQAFVSAEVLNSRYHLNQGFDGYDDDLSAENPAKLFMVPSRPARHTAPKVVEWLKSLPQGKRAPYFLWVHFYDPHQPHEPPIADVIRTLTSYDAEISAADDGIGQILETVHSLGRERDTVVTLTSDHGESLGEHEEKTHAVFIYDATVHVPLIMRYPRLLPSGKLYDSPVRHVDIAPTLLAMAGIAPAHSEMQGVNLLPALLGHESAPKLTQYSESLLAELGFGMAPLHALREEGYKWIRAPKPELYDLKTDPAEVHNLYPQQPSRWKSLDHELDQVLTDSEKRNFQPQEVPVERDTLQMLQSLGYLQPEADRKSMGGMDPKDGIDIYNQLEHGRHLAQAQRWPQAEEVLRKLLAEHPQHSSARDTLGLVLTKQKKWKEATENYLTSLAQQPRQYRVLAALAAIEIEQEHWAAARKYLLQSLQLTPDFAEGMIHLGFMESLQGRLEEAEIWYQKALALNKGSPLLLRRIGDLYFERGLKEQALHYYQATLERKATDFQAMIQAGNSASELPKYRSQAVGYYQSAAKIRPDSWIPDFNIACQLGADGNTQGALTSLKSAISKGLRDRALVENADGLKQVRELSEFSDLARKLHLPSGKARPANRS